MNKGKNSKNKENNHSQKKQVKKFISNQNKETVHADAVKLPNVARKEDSDVAWVLTYPIPPQEAQLRKEVK